MFTYIYIYIYIYISCSFLKHGLSDPPLGDREISIPFNDDIHDIYKPV